MDIITIVQISLAVIILSIVLWIIFETRKEYRRLDNEHERED